MAALTDVHGLAGFTVTCQPPFRVSRSAVFHPIVPVVIHQVRSLRRRVKVQCRKKQPGGDRMAQGLEVQAGGQGATKLPRDVIYSIRRKFNQEATHSDPELAKDAEDNMR